LPDSKRSKPPRHTLRGLLKPWELLLFGLVSISACGSLGGLAAWMDIRDADKAFGREVDAIQHDLAQRFGSAEAVLTSLAGLQQASDDFNKHQFGALSRELLSAYPYIRTISEIGAMPRDQRPAFEDTMQDNGYLNFQVTEGRIGGIRIPAGDRDVTMPIRLFEPFDPEFSGLIGFDVQSDPTLSVAVNEAISTGKVVSSAAVSLANVPNGFFAFKAYYLGHVAPTTPAERRVQLSGLVALYLRPDLLVDGLIKPDRNFGIRLLSRSGIRQYADIRTETSESVR
jgi:CHASE1-domain containing sensor protein